MRHSRRYALDPSPWLARMRHRLDRFRCPAPRRPRSLSLSRCTVSASSPVYVAMRKGYFKDREGSTSS